MLSRPEPESDSLGLHQKWELLRLMVYGSRGSWSMRPCKRRLPGGARPGMVIVMRKRVTRMTVRPAELGAVGSLPVLRRYHTDFCFHSGGRCGSVSKNNCIVPKREKITKQRSNKGQQKVDRKRRTVCIIQAKRAKIDSSGANHLQV